MSAVSAVRALTTVNIGLCCILRPRQKHRGNPFDFYLPARLDTTYLVVWQNIIPSALGAVAQAGRKFQSNAPSHPFALHFPPGRENRAGKLHQHDMSFVEPRLGVGEKQMKHAKWCSSFALATSFNVKKQAPRPNRSKLVASAGSYWC